MAMDAGKSDAEVKLARAETLLRLGSGVAEELVALVGSEEASLATRRKAAALLGWYGGPKLEDLLQPTCSGEGNAAAVLCWDTALALARQGGPKALERLDQVAKAGDKITRQYLARYRPRLALIKRCGGKASCLQAALESKDWRERERAALEAAGGGSADFAARLARQYATEEQAEVRQAILVTLEQVSARAALPSTVAASLLKVERKIKPGAGERPTAALRSRVVCLAEQIKRSKRKGAGK